MRRTRRTLPGRTVLAALLAAGCLTVSARGDQKPPPSTVQELNRVSGSNALKGRLDQLLKDKDQAKALIKQARAQLKENKDALAYNAAYVLAEAARELEDTSAAEAFYRACAAQASKLESTSKLIQAYSGLIDLAFDSKKYEATARVCRELLELKPPTDRPRLILLAVTNRFGDADFEELEGFNAAAPVRPAVHRLLIQAVAKQGKTEEALKLVDTLIKLQPSWEEFELKGMVLREAGRSEEAAKVYEDVIDRLRKDKELKEETRQRYEERSRYILSNLYVDLKQIDRATEQLKTLVAKHPDEPGYHNDLGYIWADNNMNLDEAEKLIRKALDLDAKRRKENPKLEQTENGAYLDSLGWVLFRKKQFKEAKEVMLKAVQDKNSQHIEIYDHLGDIHMALGEREAALQAWRRGVELAGTSRREKNRKAEVEKKLSQAK